MLLGSWGVVHTHTYNEREHCGEGYHKELRRSLGRLCQIVKNVEQDHTSPQKHDAPNHFIGFFLKSLSQQICRDFVSDVQSNVVELAARFFTPNV